MAHQNYGPEKDRGGQVSPNGELDETDRAWETCSEVAEVEGTASPRVLLANEVLRFELVLST